MVTAPGVVYIFMRHESKTNLYILYPAPGTGCRPLAFFTNSYGQLFAFEHPGALLLLKPASLQGFRIGTAIEPGKERARSVFRKCLTKKYHSHVPQLFKDRMAQPD